jgi:hydrogenase maturation protease
MLEEYDAVILVDAMPRGGAPGTLYVLEPRTAAGREAALDGHSMDPVKVLEAVAALGGKVDRVLVVGCEPAARDAGADWEQSLSEPVRAAMDEAVALVESLARDIYIETWPPRRVATGGIDHESASVGG